MPRRRNDAGGQATIVSSDKDLMQLIRPGVEMLDPIKQKPIGPAEVMEKFGVTPDKMIDVQALIGDSTDNVPGVPGIGPKGAAQLINEFGDLDSVLAAAPAMKPSKRRDNLIEHADKARLSRELVTLRTDTPMPVPVDQLHARPYDKATLAAWLKTQGFRSIATRLGLDSEAAAAGRDDGGGGTAARAGGTAARRRRPSRRETASGFGPYATITTEAALRDFLAEIATCGFLAIDTETDGLDALRAPLVGLSLAVAPGRAAYLPLRHEGLAEQVPLAAAIAALGPVLTDRGMLKIYQNAKFDMLVMERAGLPAVRAVRRCDADLLRPGGRHARPRAGRAGAAASRPHADQLRRGHRHRAQPHSVRGRCRSSAPPPMPPRRPMWRCACGRRCGRGCASTAALALYEQVERRLLPVLLDDGTRRHQGRRRRSAPHVGGLRAAHGGDRARHPSPRRPRIQCRFARSSSARCCSTR